MASEHNEQAQRSGKSTLTRKLRSLYQLSNWIDPDVVANGIAGNNHVTEEISQLAFQDARAQRVHLASRLESFGFETVFSHSSNIEFLEALSVLGYDVHLFFVCTEHPEINIARVENRVALGGHSVPRVKIVDRYRRSRGLAFPASRVVQRMVLFDNSSANEPGRVVGEILRQGSELRLFPAPTIPVWVSTSIVSKYASPQYAKPFRYLTEEKYPYKTASLATLHQRHKFMEQFLV